MFVTTGLASSAVGSPPDPRVFSLLPTFPNVGSDTSLKTYLPRSGVKSQVDCVRVGDYPSDMRTDAALLKNRALFVLLAACDSTLADKGRFRRVDLGRVASGE